MVSWQGAPGIQYEVYSSDDLEAWSFAGTFEGVAGEMSWTDEAALEQGVKRRYYKVLRRLPLSKGNTLEPVPAAIEVTYDGTTG